MLKDNLKLHGNTNQACNVQGEEEKENLKLCIISYQKLCLQLSYSYVYIEYSNTLTQLWLLKLTSN